MSRSRSKQNRNTRKKFIVFAENCVNQNLIVQCAVGGEDRTFTLDELGLEKFHGKVEQALLTNRHVKDVSLAGNVVSIETMVTSDKYQHRKSRYQAMIVEIRATVEATLQEVCHDWFFAIPHPRDKPHQDKYAGRRDKHKRRTTIPVSATS